MSALTEFPSGRYLVTGGAGFIGSHLCETLLELGADVVAVDSFLTGRPENIQPLLRNGRFSFQEADITKHFELLGPWAGIFHMASPASPVDYMKFPLETLRVGSIGTDHVLSLARKENCPVLVASTSEVYGDPQEHPQKESYWGHVNPTGPRSCYDESKRYLEALTMAYHRQYGLQTRIARIFNTYGPRMRLDDGRVVPNFVLQALRGQKLTVYGDGSQTRSFCYVSDLVHGLLRLFLSGHSDPVNLGNPQEMSIRTFAETIARLAKRDFAMEPCALPQDDPKTRRPDITKAKTLLKWEPRVSLEEGLTKTFAYFKDFQ